MEYKELIEKAREAQTFSYSPYSKFRVGAFLVSFNDTTYNGCNVENASYGLSNCAERTAIFTAVANGEKSFKSITIVSDAETYIPPCGACRQVMLEFFDENTEIILANSKNEFKVFNINELIPFSFNDKFLTKL